MHILCMENRIFQLELTKVNTTEKEKEGGEKKKEEKKISIGRATRKW